ncbi:MAG: hypothetical protein Q3959_00635 [Limosilactobacillus sp.]|uniref:DUF6681 family protein n=1 Tax=Limosilactobacillus sp. TaxID=2773925 RepID=UPI0027016656|nr:hypothetical protein [Limosilactobacillus sp.]
MFTLLDMINSSLSYINIEVKLKNRIYIGIATLGDIYLIYVTFRLLANQAYLRGFLYFLAMIAITYFLYLNIVFFFLGRTSRFDFISPKVAKMTRQKFDNDGRRVNRNGARGAGMAQPAYQSHSNGLFAGSDTIPAAVEIDATEQRNLQDVVDQLLTEGIFQNDFDGMDDEQIIAQYNATGKPVQALNVNSVPPYFELIHDEARHRLEIYMGLNQMDRMPVGHITRIGLTDVRDAHHKYQIYLAGLAVTDGPNKIPGRRGSTIMTSADYGLNAQVAYRERQ